MTRQCTAAACVSALRRCLSGIFASLCISDASGKDCQCFMGNLSCALWHRGLPWVGNLLAATVVQSGNLAGACSGFSLTCLSIEFMSWKL